VITLVSISARAPVFVLHAHELISLCILLSLWFDGGVCVSLDASAMLVCGWWVVVGGGGDVMCSQVDQGDMVSVSQTTVSSYTSFSLFLQNNTRTAWM
jgi:hypothetical protein